MEGEYTPIVGSISMDGEVRWKESNRTHTGLGIHRGKCWRYQSATKTVYWHGDASEHDDHDEEMVRDSLEAGSYPVVRQVTLDELAYTNRGAWNKAWNAAHGYEAAYANRESMLAESLLEAGYWHSARAGRSGGVQHSLHWVQPRPTAHDPRPHAEGVSSWTNALTGRERGRSTPLYDLRQLRRWLRGKNVAPEQVAAIEAKLRPVQEGWDLKDDPEMDEHAYKTSTTGLVVRPFPEADWEMFPKLSKEVLTAGMYLDGLHVKVNARSGVEGGKAIASAVKKFGARPLFLQAYPYEEDYKDQAAWDAQRKKLERFYALFGFQSSAGSDSGYMYRAANAENDHATQRFSEAMVAELLEGDDLDLFPQDTDMGRRPAVSTVDFKELQNVAKYPMFKHDQPQIGAFAQQSPQNMAKLLIFVVASIKVAWPVLDRYFEEMFAYLAKHGAVDYDEREKKPKWNILTIGKTDSINRLWKWRQVIFKSVMQAVEADTKAGDTGFLVYKKLLQMPSLGLPKAGFATQLLVGKYGCVDSVNLNLLNTRRPIHLMNKQQTAFHSVGSKLPKEKQPLLKGLTKHEGDLARLLLGDFRGKDLSTLRQYGDYLAQLEQEGLGTEGLWNLWCGVVAHKIEHYGGKPIDIVMPNQSEPARLKSYNAVPAELVQKSREKIAPSGAFDTQRAASVISGDHRRMITGESLANSLLESTGAWMDRHGALHDISSHWSHIDWAMDNVFAGEDVAAEKVYGLMFERGWIRLAVDPRLDVVWVEGNLTDLQRRSIKLWAQDMGVEAVNSRTERPL